MNEIAGFTTPSLWFKPSSVEATDISKIFLVLSQDGNEILRKDITQAQISEGRFVWVFSQEHNVEQSCSEQSSDECLADRKSENKSVRTKLKRLVLLHLRSNISNSRNIKRTPL